MASPNGAPHHNMPRVPLPRFQIHSNIPLGSSRMRSSSMNRLSQKTDSEETGTTNKKHSGEKLAADAEIEAKTVQLSVKSAASSQSPAHETSTDPARTTTNAQVTTRKSKSSHRSIVSQPSVTETDDLNLSSVTDQEIQAASRIQSESISSITEATAATTTIEPVTTERRTQRTDSFSISSNNETPESLTNQSIQSQNNVTNFLDFNSLINFGRLFQRYIKPMPIPNIDGFSPTSVAFIHLDPYVSELPTYYWDVIGPVLVDYCLKDTEACINLIHDYYMNKRIFLLSAGGIATDLVPKVHKLNQIHAIYIHCENVQYHKQWTKEFEKVRIVCSDDKRELLPTLATDLAFVYEFQGDKCLEEKNNKAAQKRYRKTFQILQNITHDPQWSESIQGKLLSLEE